MGGRGRGERRAETTLSFFCMTQSQLSVVQTQMRIPGSRLLSLSFGEEEIEAQEGSLSLAGPGLGSISTVENAGSKATR